MKLDKKLLNNMKNVLKEAVEKTDIENNISEISTDGFNEEVEYNKLPSNISALFRFPYISNVADIDNIKYNSDTKSLMITFKLGYKKLSDIFISKANSLNLLRDLSKTNGKDTIRTIGLENQRLIIIIELNKPLSMTTANEEETETIKESVEGFEFASVSSFKQAMSSLVATIQTSVTDAQTDEEKHEIKEIWKDTLKNINDLL